MICRKTSLPRDEENEVVIDLDNMTITFHQPRGGDVVLVGLLRRLSTQSYITCPCDPVCTKWKWYWKDNGNVWRMYDKDFLVSWLVFICGKIPFDNRPWK